MSNLIENPEDEIWCDKDGIAGEGKYDPSFITATDIKLKPCPFCGAIPNFHPSHLYPNGEWGPAYVKCLNCRVLVSKYGANGSARVVEAWNNRPEEEAQAGIIAILELFRDDAKSVAEEAMTLIKEIAFHGSTPERRQRVVDDLRRIVSREEI